MTTVEFKSLDIAAFVPNKAGVYIIMNSLKKAIYVGQSATLKNRLLEHAGRTSEQSRNNQIIREFPTEIYYASFESFPPRFTTTSLRTKVRDSRQSKSSFGIFSRFVLERSVGDGLKSSL